MPAPKGPSSKAPGPIVSGPKVSSGTSWFKRARPKSTRMYGLKELDSTKPGLKVPGIRSDLPCARFKNLPW